MVKEYPDSSFPVDFDEFVEAEAKAAAEIVRDWFKDAWSKRKEWPDEQKCRIIARDVKVAALIAHPEDRTMIMPYVGARPKPDRRSEAQALEVLLEQLRTSHVKEAKAVVRSANKLLKALANHALLDGRSRLRDYAALRLASLDFADIQRKIVEEGEGHLIPLPALAYAKIIPLHGVADAEIDSLLRTLKRLVDVWTSPKKPNFAWFFYNCAKAAWGEGVPAAVPRRGIIAVNSGQPMNLFIGHALVAAGIDDYLSDSGIEKAVVRGKKEELARRS